MVKITTTVQAPKTQDGEAINLAPKVQETDERAFRLIPANYYAGLIMSIASKSYNSTWGKGDNAKKNPTKGSNGLWEYHALTPLVKLLNGEQNEGVNSIISRQDVTLGILHNGQWYRPDGSNDMPFFRDAANLLASVSMFEQDGDSFVINGDTDHIIERPTKVRVGHGGYVAGRNINLNPKQLAQEFARLNGDSVDYTFDDLSDLTHQYNVEKGYTDENGESLDFIYTDKDGKELETPLPIRLKLKNVITAWFFPTDVDVRINKWYVRDGKIFASEKHADSFYRVTKADSNANEENLGY